MEKEKLVAFLQKYDYNFRENSQSVVVNLDFNQKVFIDFSETGKVKITDRLTPWNFLTGIMEMSLKSAMIYNFIGLIIITALFLFLEISTNQINISAFFFLFSVWVLLFSAYYLVKLEGFKTQILDVMK